jgi:hypothetical protein
VYNWAIVVQLAHSFPNVPATRNSFLRQAGDELAWMDCTQTGNFSGILTVTDCGNT